MKAPSTMREYNSPDSDRPRIALLGREPFTTIVTNAGGGQTRFGPIVLNRWRSDPVLDDFGQFFYIRDLTDGTMWSPAYQPLRVHGDSYHVKFDGESAVFERRDGDIATVMTVAVASEEAAELRKITLGNHSSVPHEIEITSYMEVAIATPLADRGHPVFSNLFVQTEWLESAHALLAMRRPRSALNKPIWCGHVMSSPDAADLSCETDRARFIGRGRSAGNPVAMDNPGALSGTVGAVLDPVFAIRARVTIPAGGTKSISFATFMAEDRRTAVELAKRYAIDAEVENSFARARGNERGILTDLGIEQESASLYQDMAGHLLFPAHSNPELEFDSEIAHFEENEPSKVARRDVPFVMATIGSASGLVSLERVLEAHRYWEEKGLASDLIILSTGSIDGLPDTSGPEGVFLVDETALTSDEKSALALSARLTIHCDSVDFDTYRSHDSASHPPEIRRTQRSQESATDGSGLEFFNGFGGFNDRSEYEIRISGNHLPPAPWINVIANARGGFIVSETGAGPTWAVNSSQFRLTPWQNDPVSDRIGECIYIRDAATRELWSATPAPVFDGAAWRIRHGAGYSVFESSHGDIDSSLRVGVPPDDAVKIEVLTLTNRGDRPRSLHITSFAEWVLGGSRETTRYDVRTSFEDATQTMRATNPLDGEFAKMIAFAAISEKLDYRGSSRSDFIGRNGAYASPAFAETDATIDTADPCSALGTTIELGPGESKRIVILLGAEEGAREVSTLVRRYLDPDAADAAIDASIAAWRKRLDAIRVKTPERAFDLMINQWALYQALSGRIWGRIALYQSSGAFGFRDQLQDVAAFVYAEPSIAREQIVRAASRQFEEGDVQHWWHPHSGRGIRTRFADDLVWLPLILDHYLRVTHDFPLLDEETPYLRMRELEPGEEEIYAVPEVSSMKRSIFDHCVHALNRATTKGAHGLPLIRSGDWNDGMNRVGVEGKGESVWLGWFFIDTLRRFAAYAEARGDDETAHSFRQKASEYRQAIEDSAWDGEWYRRAYYDDGAPLGSHANSECQIDSIAQSWSVISRAGDAKRGRIAMESLNRWLVRDDAQLIMLLTPPFDRGTHDPGYIQGYLPGVRENGAQYTHAALWAVLATAMLGDGDRALELYQMINPVTHGDSPAKISTYKVEPYVVAADVYTAEGHLGRGGWTWYTGSASWLYRTGLEGILGFTKRGETLEIDPCIPSSWKEFTIEYTFGGTPYVITVRNPSGVQKGVLSVVVDGNSTEGVVRLFDDGQRHEVTVTLGRL